MKTNPKKIGINDFKKDAEKLSTDLSNASTKPGNACPIHCLPNFLENTINEFHTAFKLPKDYFMLSMLTGIGAIFGNTFALEYKRGQRYTSLIYGAIVGNSSIGKSPAINLSIKALMKKEAEYYEQYRIKLAQWELENTDNADAKSKSKKPVANELIVNDATIEALNKVLMNNPNGVLLVVDELMGWLNNMSKYNSGSDEHFWLSNWSSVMSKNNRATKDTTFNPCLFIGILGGIQPGLLKNFGRGNRIDNGLLARFLHAYPENQIKPYDDDNEISQEVIAFYDGIFDRIFEFTSQHRMHLEQGEKKLIRLDKGARRRFLKWKNHNTDLTNQSEFDSIKSIYGKLETYCLRIALILTLIEESNKTTFDVSSEIFVTLAIIENAIELIEYFRYTSLQVLDIIEGINPIAELSMLQQRIYAQLPNQFPKKEGVIVAQKLGMADRTFSRFLKNKIIFCREKHGIYVKKL
jgi:hypothetical protein